MATQTDKIASLEGHLIQVERALDAAFDRARREESKEGVSSLDVSTARYIIFSDVHRGTRDGADDFRRTERAYNAAMAYYFKMGHTLVVLGDVEELWEERPAPVLRAYERTFELEAQFHQQGRYVRIWGNHDDEWQYEGSVKHHLDPLYKGEGLKVRESLRIEVMDGAERLGSLFLIHGHQGDAVSDTWSRVARLFVRYVWRPIQRITHLSANTPAESWKLRERYNIAMYHWAEKRDKLVLIAGHTHRPVFKAKSHEAQIKEKLAKLEEEVGGTLSREQVEALAALLAKLEWVRAQENQAPGRERDTRMVKPCYFNTGCSCYLDGDITGVEIADGEIRLVRWPDEEGEPKPHILARDRLRDVLQAC